MIPPRVAYSYPQKKMVLALDYIFVIFFISYLSGLILQSLLSKASKESARLVSYFLFSLHKAHWLSQNI